MNESAQPKCKYLRQEDFHLPEKENLAFWEKGEPATSHYWCVLTMSISGPDTGPVDVRECGGRRGCFLKD
ncbi:MAG: hypothetical protein E4H13_07050 [Calditrichales bacterium]|nr:MAG: hypothetical protein E4H13_07050 [Calditrichales bacterium]